MTKRMGRLPSDNPPFLDLLGHPRGSAFPGRRFNIKQLAQIHRTVNRVPDLPRSSSLASSLNGQGIPGSRAGTGSYAGEDAARR